MGSSGVRPRHYRPHAADPLERLRAAVSDLQQRSKQVAGLVQPVHCSADIAEKLALLGDLDDVLKASGLAHFNLPPWIAAARAWASPTSEITTSSVNASTGGIADFYEYNARNESTLWGPRGQINDYASKHWDGLVRSYYLPGWEMFVEYTLNGTLFGQDGAKRYEDAAMEFEMSWQRESMGRERRRELYACGWK